MTHRTWEEHKTPNQTLLRNQDVLGVWQFGTIYDKSRTLCLCGLSCDLPSLCLSLLASSFESFPKMEIQRTPNVAVDAWDHHNSVDESNPKYLFVCRLDDLLSSHISNHYHTLFYIS